jgi:hypothetical protein
MVAKIEHERFARRRPRGGGPVHVGRFGKQVTTHLLHLPDWFAGAIWWSFYARELTARRTNKVSGS